MTIFKSTIQTSDSCIIPQALWWGSSESGGGLSGCEWGTHSFDQSGPDLGPLGVKGDAHWPVVDAAGLKALTGLADILDGLRVVLENT